MKYVINPWIIYAIDKFDVILIIAMITVILSSIAIPVLWVIKDGFKVNIKDLVEG